MAYPWRLHVAGLFRGGHVRLHAWHVVSLPLLSCSRR